MTNEYTIGTEMTFAKRNLITGQFGEEKTGVVVDFIPAKDPRMADWYVKVDGTTHIVRLDEVR